MIMALPNLPQVEVAGRAQLFEWLERNHASGQSVLLVTFKKKHAAKYTTKDDILDATVAYGWTDGRRWAIDADRTMQLISPRKTLVWARTYKERADRLIREGLMKPAGLKAIEDAKAAGAWHIADQVDDLLMPTDLTDAFSSSRDAYEYFLQSAASYRRNVLRWLHAAKTDGTRAKRIDIIVSASHKQERMQHF